MSGEGRLFTEGYWKMKLKAVSGIMLTLLLIGVLTPAVNISLVRSEPIPMNIGGSLSPGYYETSEFLIGSVAVGVIFPESNGSIDPSTEDWTSAEESFIMDIITYALDYWADYASYTHAEVAFSMEVHYRVPTGYEPINRSLWDHAWWIPETIEYLGHPSVLDYVNDLRNRLGTNWAFLIFVVDSSNDADGCFTDGWYAHAPIGGPYIVMTLDGPHNGGLLDFMFAHEIGHTFYATDEYNGVREYSGYLNVSDNDYAPCLMYRETWQLCDATKEQIGWRDTDGDGILDIVDTFPETTLNPILPDPTTDNYLTCTGSVTEVPYPNRNPYTYTWPEHCMTFFPIPRTRRNITINTITKVEFRVDGGSWRAGSVTPTDGAFDENQEDFAFTTPWLSGGPHTIEVRGTNSVGNIETTYASDTVYVIPRVVGGEATPINMPMTELHIPLIWLSTIMLSLALAVVYIKKRKRQ